MKRLENYLNVLHFCFYRAHYKLHLFANKINLFHLIHKLPFQKRKYEELGINIYKEIDKAVGNKEYGISMTVAGGALLGILFFFILADLNILLKLLSGNITLSAEHFISCGILSVALSYFFVFKNDKYLSYFEQFEEWGKADKSKYGWLTFAFVLLVFCLFILSLKMCHNKEASGQGDNPSLIKMKPERIDVSWFLGQGKTFFFEPNDGNIRYDMNRNYQGRALITGISPTLGFKGSSVFIKGLGAVETELFHLSIKPDILQAAGNFSKVVGRNPDIAIKEGLII